MQQLKPKTTLIRVSTKTYADLAKLGGLDDSFDSVIQKLLKRPRK